MAFVSDQVRMHTGIIRPRKHVELPADLKKN